MLKRMISIWHTVTKIHQPLPQPWQLTLGVSSLVLIFCFYTYLAEQQHRINPLDTTIPTWGQLADGIEIIFEVNERTGTRMIVEDLLATGYRILLGLSCAVFVAIILGMHMGCFSVIESFCKPPLVIIAQFVPTAMLPVFFATVGMETKMYVTVLMFGIMPPLAIAISLTVKDFTEEEIDMALTLGASKFEIVWVLIFRSILPRLFELARAHVGPALVYLIAGEILCADDGFGPRIRIESRSTNMHIVYPYVVILALLGLAIRRYGSILMLVLYGAKAFLKGIRRVIRWGQYYRPINYLIGLGQKKSSTI